MLPGVLPVRAGRPRWRRRVRARAARHRGTRRFIGRTSSASLLLGELALLSGDVDAAVRALRLFVRWAEQAGCRSANSIALEQLAEVEVARGNRDAAPELLAQARSLAVSSWIPSYLMVRVFGVQVLAARNVVDALRVIREAERWLIDAPGSATRAP